MIRARAATGLFVSGILCSSGTLFPPGLLGGCTRADHILGNVGQGGEAGGQGAGGRATGGQGASETAGTASEPDASGAAGGPPVLNWPSRDLILEITPEFEDPNVPENLESWLLNVHLSEGRSWIAAMGERSIDGTGSRVCTGTTWATDAWSAAAVTLAPERTLSLGRASLHLDSILLRVDERGSINGTATGTFSKDSLFLEAPAVFTFTAVVAGRPDNEAPTATMFTGPVVLSIDSLWVSLSEPIALCAADSDDVRVLDESGAVLATGVGAAGVAADNRLAIEYEPSRPKPLPAGELLEVWLMHATDSAGNTQEAIRVGSTRVATTPQGTMRNLGFESGLDGWIPQYRDTEAKVVTSYEIADWDDAGGEPLSILPPEGTAMAWIPPFGRLAGYVTVPDGVTAICMQVGILHARLAEVGEEPTALHIDMGTSADNPSFRHAFAPYDKPKSGWTGFREICSPVDAPPGESWFTIQGNDADMADADPEAMNSVCLDHELLIDDLYFR
jgi:hypothetical protein